MTKRLAVVSIFIAATAIVVAAQQKDVQMKDLPAAVQKSVQEQTQGATLKRLTSDVLKDKTLYEAETMRTGLMRCLLFDGSGAVVGIEEQVANADVPAAVRAAMAARGKVTSVGKLTKGSVVAYEAEVTRKGRKTWVVLDPSGKTTKLELVD